MDRRQVTHLSESGHGRARDWQRMRHPEERIDEGSGLMRNSRFLAFARNDAVVWEQVAQPRGDRERLRHPEERSDEGSDLMRDSRFLAFARNDTW
jgi:hypothetical protein